MRPWQTPSSTARSRVFERTWPASVVWPGETGTGSEPRRRNTCSSSTPSSPATHRLPPMQPMFIFTRASPTSSRRLLRMRPLRSNNPKGSIVQLHHVRVHRSEENLAREDQLAWKIAACAADPVGVTDDVTEMVINRVIDNASAVSYTHLTLPTIY